MENSSTNKEALEQLRAILLKEDRSKLEVIRDRLDSAEEFSNRVSPIIEERLEFFKAEFPNEFRIVIQGFIDERIESSQEEILNVINEAARELDEDEEGLFLAKRIIEKMMAMEELPAQRAIIILKNDLHPFFKIS